ncbi:MAG: hypothetical protein ACR2QE_02875 [Acidimicrobiales bacterium]
MRLVVVMTAMVIAGVIVVAAAGWWARSEPRVDYRADRRRLRRDQRRWRRLQRRLGAAGHAQYDVVAREIELSLKLAQQSLRSRRRTTGPVWFVRLSVQPGPERRDTPFERTYLEAVERHLDKIQAGMALGVSSVTETGDQQPRPAVDSVLVEPL